METTAKKIRHQAEITNDLRIQPRGDLPYLLFFRGGMRILGNQIEDLVREFMSRQFRA